MPASVPAPRAFDQAAALCLASSDFPARFRWDAPARTWRRRSGDRWHVVYPEAVVAAAAHVLEAALAAEDVPLVFRCVFAPPAYVDALQAVESWEADREAHARAEYEHLGAWEEREAHKRAERIALQAALDAGDAGPSAHYRLKQLEPRPYTRLAPAATVTRNQRERLRRAVSRRGVESAVRNASGLDAFAYAAEDAPVDVDPRAWLTALPRVPGGRVLTSDLYAAYVASLPTGSRPLHNRAFHALAVEILGEGDAAACRRRIRGRDFYLAVSLPNDDDRQDGTPPLRLVSSA
ncbi:hypothetical protein [Nocardioides sp. Leaf374]|uniref:hypothetical protein n=1 Tax=Nocardioides sp. Leaf374 TaxID=2876560 RepID=UPI001E61F6DA|nr:hypothetical protein [Nocardioides sp. Leaf374]